MSLNPRGIVFVPKHLNEIEIESGVEVIYSYAFFESNIKNLSLPRSLKKIRKLAFGLSNITSISFEKGTELDYIDMSSIDTMKAKSLKLPLIKEMRSDYKIKNIKTIEFPSNFKPKKIGKFIFSNLKKVACPRSSLQTLLLMENRIRNASIIIVED